jgi:YesN/AraC family two-component response regulator
MGLRQPLIYRQSPEESVNKVKTIDPAEITPPKYEKSGLSAEDQQSIWEALQACMRTDRLHQRADLTLSILAETLNVRAAHLSQTINVEAGMNFFDFINQYRIQEAKTLLRQNGSDIPLSTMCYEVGFNSKSTFYSQFKKHSDGMTPRQYINSLPSQ